MAMVWLNGALVADDIAKIPVSDRGFLLGDGLFETIRVVDGAPALLDRHLARLAASLSLIGAPSPMDDDALTQAIRCVIAANAVTFGSLRLTVTRGSGPRGLSPPPNPSPTVLITTGATPPGGPVRLVTARDVRRNEFSVSSRVKSLNYLDGIMAKGEADRAGADDAVLLNTQGRVAETTVATVFADIDGVIVTPPVDEGALPGVRRALILERLAVVQRRLTPGELAGARSLALTNALTIRAVASLDGETVDDLSLAPRLAEIAD